MSFISRTASSRILSALLLIGSACLQAETPQAEQPWPEELIRRLPPEFQEATRRHAEGPVADLAEYAALDDQGLLSRAVKDIHETDAGALALLEVFRTAPSLESRLVVARRLGEFGHFFASEIPGVKLPTKPYSPETYAQALSTYEQQIASAPNTEYGLSVLHELTKLERRRLRPIVGSLLEQALQKNDPAGADLWRRKSAELFFGRVALAEFHYRAPPVFEVAPRSQKNVSVLMFGDFGNGKPSQFDTAAAMRAYHAKKPFTFGLTVGDNFYSFGLDDPEHERWKRQWEEPYGPLGIVFYPTYGNHDYMSLDSPAAELAYTRRSKSWRFPAPFYTYTAGSAQFFGIDTQTLYDNQLAWLEQALKSSTARWKIVYGHYPVYVSTPNAGRLENMPDGMVARLLPVLKRGRADAYIAGHHHSLQDLKPEEGVNFFVVGAGGATLYDKDPNYPRTIFTSDEFGFGVLDVGEQKLSLSFVNQKGKVIHQREIRK